VTDLAPPKNVNFMHPAYPLHLFLSMENSDGSSGRYILRCIGRWGIIRIRRNNTWTRTGARSGKCRSLARSSGCERTIWSGVSARGAGCGADVASMLEEQCVIALGGSVTLAETGALKLVRSDMYHLIDRYEPDLPLNRCPALHRLLQCRRAHQQCQRHHRAWGTVLCGRHEQPWPRCCRAERVIIIAGMAEDRADAAGRRRPGKTYRGTGERDAP
jgi:hypothetical protein